jgi:hypothetical protein
MANQLKENPWLADTVAVLHVGMVKVQHFEFVDYTADGHKCSITNSNDVVVWNGDGEADLSPVGSHHIGWVNGLKLASIDSGKVLIYFQ